jgi:hypothetical protein
MRTKHKPQPSMTPSLILLALWCLLILLGALGVIGCSQVGTVAPSAPMGDIAVTVFDRDSQSPMRAHIHALPDYHTNTDDSGRAVVPAVIGADVVITASAPGFVSMTVRGVLSNGNERWGFYLERMR